MLSFYLLKLTKKQQRDALSLSLTAAECGSVVEDCGGVEDFLKSFRLRQFACIAMQPCAVLHRRSDVTLLLPLAYFGVVFPPEGTGLNR